MIFPLVASFLISQVDLYPLSAYCIANGDQTAQCRISQTDVKIQCLLASAGIIECESAIEQARYQCIVVQMTQAGQGYLSCKNSIPKEPKMEFPDPLNLNYLD